MTATLRRSGARMTVAEALAWAGERLNAASVASPRLDARLLVAHATGKDAAALRARPGARLSTTAWKRLERVVARRCAREPISRITGTREFWSLPIGLSADTLDPRPDSETVVQAVLERFPAADTAFRVLDLGTGSGCLLLAILSERRRATGVGIDIARGAVETAQKNAKTLGLSDRAAFQVGDWGVGLVESFDCIVTNPPYIPEGEVDSLDAEVACFEPRSSLAGGKDGLERYRELGPEIYRLLTPEGAAFLEIGAGQAQHVERILTSAGISVEGVRADLGGRPRCVIGARAPVANP